MLKLSPAMETYEKSLLDELHRSIAIAKEARSRGLDPSTDVEIPIANDLADRVEVLVGVKGVAVRIRELEATMSREEAALRIGDDFVARKFGEKNNDEVLDHAIRVAMALLTEGVVSAPTEGIAKVSLGRNDDGSSYLMIFYAGPIRSAGVRHRRCRCWLGITCARSWVSTGTLPGRKRLSGTSRRSANTTRS